MSAMFDEAQITNVINELEKIKDNINTKVRPQTVNFMNSIMRIAEQDTHKISGRLASGWYVTDSQGQTIVVTLDNNVEYAPTEFDRLGIRNDVGTPHDVRPQLADMANNNVEEVVFNAVTDGVL